MPRLAVNGVSLNVESTGDGPPLLLLHGFTGSAATWAPLLPVLAQRRRAIAVDLIGHGESDAPADFERYRAERCVEDLIAVLDQLGVDRADVLGYSMGGRVALHLAAAAPGRIRTLALGSATAGIADPAERQARVESDRSLAESIERDGLAAFVERWESLPLFASQARLPPEVRERARALRLRNDPRGLANSLRGMGTGSQPSLWHRLPDLRVPTLLVAGSLDAKFCALARAMHGLLPAARLVIVPDAGHNVHLEQPAIFARTLLEFLDGEPSGKRSSL